MAQGLETSRYLLAWAIAGLLLVAAGFGISTGACAQEGVWYLSGRISARPTTVVTWVGMNRVEIHDLDGDGIIDALRIRFVFGGFGCYMHTHPPMQPYTSTFSSALGVKIDTKSPTDPWYAFGGEYFDERGRVVNIWRCDAFPYQRHYSEGMMSREAGRLSDRTRL